MLENILSLGMSQIHLEVKKSIAIAFLDDPEREGGLPWQLIDHSYFEEEHLKPMFKGK